MLPLNVGHLSQSAVPKMEERSFGSSTQPERAVPNRLKQQTLLGH
jgi:hypothetical protein